jgi:hypothetical protein
MYLGFENKEEEYPQHIKKPVIKGNDLVGRS